MGSLPVANYLVRYGAVGLIAPFESVGQKRWARGARVVVRSSRGMECGEVLASYDRSLPAQGVILRAESVEDQLVWARAQKNRSLALQRCEQVLAQHHLQDVLLDAEYLLDGSTLVFYFLGEPSAQAVELLDTLARELEAQVKFQDFLRLVEQGCGPECGTQEACRSCVDGCALAQWCHAHRSAATPAES